MLPAISEVFFVFSAAVKGGIIISPAPTTIMTSRELEYRFKVYPPDGVIADVDYDGIRKERPTAEAGKTRGDDIIAI